jgi:hypothetical protein
MISERRPDEIVKRTTGIALHARDQQPGLGTTQEKVA